MSWTSRSVFFAIFFACVFGVASSATDLASKYFDDGVEAFLAERWDVCIDRFEAALPEYRRAEEEDTKCRLACQMDSTKVTPMLMGGLESLQYVEKLVNKSVCLRKCTDYHPGAEYQKLKSYEYLQYCYFQKQLPQKAAVAVYTYLEQNSENSAMLDNLRFYVELPEVIEDNIADLEAEPFIELFLEGANAFESGRYAECIVFIERSLDEYHKADEGCRARCDLETPTVHALPMANYIESVASHFLHDLECKIRCPLTLVTTNLKIHEDVLPKHYHYLQLANAKVGNARASSEALASYLLFRPRDAVKLADLHRLESGVDGNKAYLQPREEAYIYVQRQDHENDLIRQIKNNFDNVFEEDDFACCKPAPGDTPAPSTSQSSVTNLEEETQQPEDLTQESQEEGTRDKRSAERNEEIETTTNNATVASDPGQAGFEKERISNVLDFNKFRDEFLQGVTLLKSGQELGGKNRLLAQGLATDEECTLMVNVAESVASQGGSYRGAVRPHDDLETFEVLTVGRVAKLVHQGRLSGRALDTFLDIGDRGRMFVKRHFHLDQKLYFHFSQLVCRQAAADDASGQGSVLMSRTIHADNCTIQPDGQCDTDQHSNIGWRDYSAIIYLNEDFEGGEFFFASDPSRSEDSIQAEVPAACGRMVAFSSGRDNLHGERAFRSGKRCTMGLWFTLNPTKSEEERILGHMYQERTRLGGGVNEDMLKLIQEK